MDILLWLLIIFGVIYWIYKQKNDSRSGRNSVEDIENAVHPLKNRLFELEHFDSPHFIDIQNAYDDMEVNYFRLKERFTHNTEKVLEIAEDWYRYVDALYELKFARLMLDVDMDDNAWDKAGESMKEPSIIKDEVEKKFKSLLGKDWQKISPDYFKRIETMKKPYKYKKNLLGEIEWKYYYSGDKNYYNLERKRQKQTEQENKKA